MNNQNPNKKTTEINVLSFGPIRLPAYEESSKPKKCAIKKKKNLLDSIVSAKAVIKKLLQNK